MSLNQIIDQDPLTTLVCDETLNLKGNQLRLKKKIVAPDGEFDNVDTVTINNTPYPPGGGFLPVPVANRILRTTGLTVEWGSVTPSNFTGGLPGDVLKTIAPGVVAWDPVKVNEITPGLANQIMHTNALGTAAEWTSTLTVPSTLTVAGSSVLQSNVNCDQTLSVDGLFSAVADMTVGGSADFAGDMTFVGNSGTVGQYLVKTGAATQDWQTLTVPSSSITAGADNTVLTSAGGAALWITPTVINLIKYGTTFLAQNINAAAGPTALQFSTSTFVDTAISTVGVPINITQPSATQFTIGTLGVYNIDITGYIDPASTGLGNSIVTLSLEVGGVEKTDYCIVCSGNYSFSGRFPAVLITAGQNIRVLARRVVGTNALTTFANGLPAPSFASSILIST